MIRLGGPIFQSHIKAAGAAESHGAAADDPAALARAHRLKGYTAAYGPRVSLRDTEKIRDIRREFAREGILIAEVGCWCNLTDTDPETRKANRAQMLDALALADELGANCVVGLAGSYCQGGVTSGHAAMNFSREAFDEAVAMARDFIDTVNPSHACFTYEVYQFGVVDSADNISALLRAVDRRQFAVHLDLTNFVNSPRTYWTTGDIMRECIRQFGDKIVSAHAKDVRMRTGIPSVMLDEVIPGEGNLDIAACIRELNKLPRQIPYMIEHLKSEEEYDRAAAHIRKVAAGEGIVL